MAAHAGNRNKIVLVGLGVIVLGGGSVWAAKEWRARQAQEALYAKLAAGSPEETRDALLALNKDELDGAVAAMKDRSFSELREMRRSEDLTVEERGQLRRVMRGVMQARQQERVNEYFNAPEEEREKVLDRHIDEMMEWRERWRAERAEREARGDDENREERRRRDRPRRTRDRQDAKERMEGGNPDQEKRQMIYRQQMRARMQARGIEMRGGPRGMGRGPGGGPRGSGGGDSGGGRRTRGR